MRRTSPPYRADHVGSLLRPAELLEARKRRDAGGLCDAELRAGEDRLIRDVVALQQDVGLESITDGEFRRFLFHLDFLSRLAGIEERGGIATKFRKKGGEVDYAPPRLVVTGKLAHTQGIQRRDFEYLQSVTTRTPKVSIPSPTMVHYRGGRQAIDAQAYPDLEEFFADLARCYREEIADLHAACGRYLQLDDKNLAYLCDPVQRESARQRGNDPNDRARRYAGGEK